MNTARLKNIFIMILVLLNACLIFLLLSRRSTEQQDYARTVSQLCALYASSDITLPEDIIPRGVTLPAAQPQRDISAEARFANALLGSETEVSFGGGIYRYQQGDSTCTFRGNGSIEALLSRKVDDPVAFCRELCAPFGYTDISSALEGQSGTVTATRTLGNAAVYNCTLTFRFREETLATVEGVFLSLPGNFDTFSESDVITALVRFFDYRSASGAVCTEVTAIRCGYLLDSSAGSQKLLRAVFIDTDVYSYFVNEESGEVLRAS